MGLPLNRSQVARLQHLQNRAIRVRKCLRKYDHVSLHRLQLNWLPISHQIMFKLSCAMYHYYHYGHQPSLIFDPPTVFGAHHSYNTCCKDSFANLLTCCFRPLKSTSVHQLLRGGTHYLLLYQLIVLTLHLCCLLGTLLQ